MKEDLEQKALKIIDEFDVIYNEKCFDNGKSFKNQSDKDKLIFADSLLESYERVVKESFLSDEQFKQILKWTLQIQNVLIPYLADKLGIMPENQFVTGDKK